MEQASMTALVSAFSRAYHSLNNSVTVFNDSLARRLLTDAEYQQIGASMAGGISFFNPAFQGTPQEALRWVVEHQLSPIPLGRAAFAEKSLERAVAIGARQLLILGAGYDTFPYRQPPWAEGLALFELDHPVTARDKRRRLEAAGIPIPGNVHLLKADFSQPDWQKALLSAEQFDGDQITFCTLLGVSYYLEKQTFSGLLNTIGGILPKGSSILFDYPLGAPGSEAPGSRGEKQAQLAEGAREKMVASYSCPEMEALLFDCGFLLYEHLDPGEMTAQYFTAYNEANSSHPMAAFETTGYCLAVKNVLSQSV